MEVDFSVGFDCSQQESDRLETLVETAVAAARQVAPELANARLSVSVEVMTDGDIHALNRDWRGKDKPTNVLSFPMLSRQELLALAPDGPPVLLGDIALSHETARQEAEDKQIRVQDHTAHLIVHGLLHLAGHDHELSEADAEEMERLEVTALALMGIANPYEASKQ